MTVLELSFQCIFWSEKGMRNLIFTDQLRLRHASSVILSGRYRVEDAARLTGYENRFNFSTTFRRAYGISPKKVQLKSILLPRFPSTDP